MNRTGVTGCCASSNFYNVGGAHGYHAPKDQDAWDDQIQKCGYTEINICITNYTQTKVREYMNTQGWTTTKVGGLYISSISYNDLVKYYNAKKKAATPPKPKKIPVKTGVTTQEIYDILRRTQGNRFSSDRQAIITALNIRYNINIPRNYGGLMQAELLVKSVSKRVAERMRKEQPLQEARVNVA
jgi:hypothetical protein